MFPTKKKNLSKRKNNESKSENFTIEDENSNMRLFTINSDIDKLYRKYSEIKKKRLSKEKTQQILVNRIKYLKNEIKRSVSKKDKKNLKNKENNIKIQMKIEENYVNKNQTKKKVNNKNKGSEKQNNLFNDTESISKISFNESESIGKSSADIKIKNCKDNLVDKENDQNLGNIINGRNDNKNVLRRNKYNIGNNNSNNNIYIIINNPKNFINENSLNQLQNTINSTFEKIPKNCDRYKRKYNKLNHKYKQEKNFINFSQNGENIILLTADEKKLQDIINSINKMNIRNTTNIHKKNNSEIINGKELNKNESISSEKNEINKKINTRNIDNNIIKNEEINEEFIRPNFLNLYNNEDNSTIKQHIDVNTFNKTESSFLQTTESFLTNNILNDKSREEMKNNNLKPKNKKNSVIPQVINKNNKNELNNFLFNTFQSFSSSTETLNKKENKKINVDKEKEYIKDDKIKNKENQIGFHDKINYIKQNLTNTKSNKKNTKQKNINSEKPRINKLRNDSYCNSIENKRKILGLEFKPNIKRELSIQTEVNSERKNNFLSKTKQDKKFNKFVFSDKLIKVKKNKILNANKNNTKKENIQSLTKNRTMTSLNRIKKKLNFVNKNDIVKPDNKKINYHIYI